jgi:hypothetical protein
LADISILSRARSGHVRMWNTYNRLWSKKPLRADMIVLLVSNTYCVVILFCFSSPMLPVSLDCPFFYSVFSNVYLHWICFCGSNNKSPENTYLWNPYNFVVTFRHSHMEINWNRGKITNMNLKVNILFLIYAIKTFSV